MAETFRRESSDAADEDLAGELQLWLGVINEASRVHDQLPEALQEEIDAGASDREIGRMILHLADLSTSTRQRMAAVIRRLLAEVQRAQVTPPGGVHRRLQVVGQSSGRVRAR